MSDPDEMIPVLFPRSLVEAMRDEVDIDYGTVRAASIAAMPTITVEIPYEVAVAMKEATVLGDYMDLTVTLRRACREALREAKS